jgi:4-hydroxy-2-oxoheptanedioate aldolase
MATALVLAGWTAGAQSPQRINRIIELLAEDQPAYYANARSSEADRHAAGRADAQTYADYLTYDMEHAPFDVKGLAEYMRGLAAGGPTRSGHRTPAVIVTVPVGGTDETTVRANAWMFQQVLATGVHGVLLCHADTPGAVRAFVEAVRLPIHRRGVGRRLGEGRRGAHGSPSAAAVWGVTPDEYDRKADVWPLNPDGELILGLKIEDTYALRNAERSLRVPGIGFAEWGPGDMTLSLGALGPDALSHPDVRAARNRVFAATKKHKVFFLESMTAERVVESVKEGVRLGPADEAAAAIGRRFTRRRLPW